MAQRTRVAILGGGCGGVAAALSLTRTAELRERFDVTLYQQGWRLGGKGASGRSATPEHRIEEHGLHVWMGWYFSAFRLAREVLDEWQRPAGCPIRTCADAFVPLWDVTLMERNVDTLQPWTIRLPPHPGRPWDDDVSPVRMLRDFSGWLQSLVFDDESPLRSLISDPRAFFLRGGLSVRLGTLLLRGWNADVRPWGDAGFSRIDHLDLRAWLASHGARDDELLDAPPIRAIYALAFAPPGGLAAGAALRTLMHVVTAYRGAAFYRMPFGMGDSFFSPALDVLRARGARVEFLHRVTGLELDDSARRVVRIALERQARTIAGAPLDGRIDVRGLRAWSSEAPWQDIVDGGALRAAGANFESAATVGGESRTLEVARDFDTVVFALPAPALPAIVADLCGHHPRWQAMMETSATTATCAVQLWLSKAVESTGRLTVGDRAPLASRADMSDVLAAETWPDANTPRGLIYLCDALANAATVDDARQDFDRWLDTQAPSIWPGFSRDWLAAEPYVRANVDPADRYVLSLPGSTQHRLGPAESGVENLFLAGDWVRTSINGGSVEAAFESGIRAAEAITASA